MPGGNGAGVAGRAAPGPKLKRVATGFDADGNCPWPPQSLRWHAFQLVNHPLFKRFILLAIVLNCMFLAADEDPNSTSVVFTRAEGAFLAIFSAELVAKVLALGVDVYLSSNWNRLDAFIVSAGIGGLLLAVVGNLSTVRLIRVLRPLRVLPQMPKVQVVVTALVGSLDLLLRAFVLFMFVIVVYAIVGVQLFRGKLHLHDGMTNFDNFGFAMLSVLNCITLDNWQDLMFAMGTSVLHIVYFVSLVFVGVFFMLNITITILKSQYVKAKAALKAARRAELQRKLKAKGFGIGSRLSAIAAIQGTFGGTPGSGKGGGKGGAQSPGAGRVARAASKVSTTKPGLRSQDSFRDRMKRIAKDATDKADNQTTEEMAEEEAQRKQGVLDLLTPWQRLVRSNKFQYSIFFCILFNTGLLAAETPYDSASKTALFFLLNYVLTIIFTVELVAKMRADGARAYWLSKNAFDGVIVVISLAEIVLLESSGSVGAFRAVRVFRLFRVLRVARLAAYLQSFQRVIKVFELASEEFGIILMLLGLFVLIYAIIGVQLFGGKIPRYTGENVVGVSSTEFANFDSFFDSFLVIFQLLTMEDWVPIMYAAVKATSWAAVVYFHSCIWIGTYIIIELFLAVLLGTFDQIFQLEKRDKDLRNKHSENSRRNGTPDIENLLGGLTKLGSGAVLKRGAKQAQAIAVADAAAEAKALAANPKIVPKDGRELAVRPKAGQLPPAMVTPKRGSQATIEALLASLHQTNPELAAIYESSPTYRKVGHGRPRRVDNHHDGEVGDYEFGHAAAPASHRGFFGTALVHETHASPVFKRSKAAQQLAREGHDHTNVDVPSDYALPNWGAGGEGGGGAGSCKGADHNVVLDVKNEHRAASPASPMTSTMRIRALLHKHRGGRETSGAVSLSAASASSAVSKHAALPPPPPPPQQQQQHTLSLSKLLSAPVTVRTMEAMHSFEAHIGSKELTVKAGDILRLPARGKGEKEDDGWVLVQRMDSSERGFVPRSYLGKEKKQILQMGGGGSSAVKREPSPPNVAQFNKLTAAGVAPLKTADLAAVVPGMVFVEEVGAATPKTASRGKRMDSARGASPFLQERLPQLTRMETQELINAREGGKHLYREYNNVEQVLKMHEKHNSNTEQKQTDEDLSSTGRSCFVCGFAARRSCYAVTSDPRFETFIISIICLSSISLALESPGLSQESKDLLGKFDFFFVAIFTIEAALKIIALTFVSHSTAYIRDPWNKLDFFIVAVSYVNIVATYMFPGATDLAFLLTLRLLRLLRPLRAVRRFPGMRIVVQAVLSCAVPAFNVFLALVLMALVFGILGVSIFGGKFGYCNDPAFTPGAPLINCTGGVYFNTTDLSVCSATTCERKWVKADLSFDNLSDAFYSLFVCSTCDGWVDIMFSAIHASSVDSQPKNGKQTPQKFAAIYFLLWICCGVWIGINLMVGVVCDHFSRMRDVMHGSVFLTAGQRRWRDTQRLMLKAKPKQRGAPPKGAVGAWCWHIATSDRFANFIMLAIAANTLVLTLTHEGMSYSFCHTLEIANTLFMVIFLVEAVLKLTGLGARVYFSSGWNRFDFFLVFTSVLDVVLTLFVFKTEQFACGSQEESSESSDLDVIFVTRLFRIFRISRIFRLLKARELQSLIFTLIYSLPSLFNVGCLMGLIFFIFAVLGMNIFGPHVSAATNTKNVDFSTFGYSMLTLFRMATYEAWAQVMQVCYSNVFDSPAVARVYFTLFVVLVNMVLLKLFVAVMVENFDMMYGSGGHLRMFNAAELENFLVCWAKLDPYASQYITLEQMQTLLRDLDPPLGLGKLANPKRIASYISMLQLTLTDGNVSFSEVLFKLTQQAFGATLDLSELTSKVVGHVKETSVRRASVLEQKTLDLVKSEAEHGGCELRHTQSTAMLTDTKLNYAALKIQAAFLGSSRSAAARQHGPLRRNIATNKFSVVVDQAKAEGQRRGGGATRNAHGGKAVSTHRKAANRIDI